jgi:dipeptide transport system substrate-binding protein
MKPDTASVFDGDANVQMLRSSPLLTAYISPNNKRKWTSDKRFREALWLAFDKKTYIQSVYGGNAKAAASFLPPGIWSYDAALAERSNPAALDRARALVKASGYDGSELTLVTRIGGSIDGKRAAELMQADWAKIGVKVKVQMMEWGELLKRTGKGEHDITFLSWAGDNGDPDNFFTPNLSCSGVESGGNKAQWCNKAFEELIATARKTADPKKRSELYKKAQKLVYDEVALIPTVYPVNMTALNKKVSGYVASPFSWNDFRSVSVK